MWTLKAKVPYNNNQLIASRTKKNQVTLIGYPTSYKIIKSKLLVTVVGHVVGEEKNKKELIKSLIKDKRIKNIEINKNTIITQFEQDLKMKVLYNENIFFISPIIATSSGENIFEIASWDRKYLEKVAKLFLSEGYDGQIVRLKKQKLDKIFSLRVVSNLTEKQERAFELAVQNNYYELPRKIQLTELAKLMNVSYTTYHFHLRTAEKKLMPLLLK